MKTFILERQDKSAEGCFGVLMLADSDDVCLTGEFPWRDNAVNVSRILTGEYRLTKHQSPKLGECLLIHPVLGRGLNPFFIRAWVQTAQADFLFDFSELRSGLSGGSVTRRSTSLFSSASPQTIKPNTRTLRMP